MRSSDGSSDVCSSDLQRRRQVHLAYNEEHGIDPQTIRKAVTDILAMLRPAETAPTPGGGQRSQSRDKVHRELSNLPGDEVRRLILTLEAEMHEASTELRFEYAARLRDESKDLKREQLGRASCRERECRYG